MQHFTIAFKDKDNSFFDIYEYAEGSHEAIKNSINHIPILKNNNDYIFRCTNESDLEWLYKIQSFSKKECDKDSLTNEGKFILKKIKEYITHILQWMKTSLKSLLDL